MSKHTTTMPVPVPYKINSEESDLAWPTMGITFHYTPGRPAYTPRGEYAPIDPPESPEVDVIAAEVVKGEEDGVDLTPEQALEWADRYVSENDIAFSDLCAHAEEDRQPDPDREYDRRRDDRLCGLD